MHRFSLFFYIFAENIYQMKRFFIFFLATLLLVPCSSLWAQVVIPTVDPTATYFMKDENGEKGTDVISADTKPLNAPVLIVFQANPTIPDGYSSNVHYTWTITNKKNASATPIVRNEQDFELEFNESGSYTVQLRAIFYGEEGVEDYEFPMEDEGEDPKLINFTISESKLEFPNAISPNGTPGLNDVLKPKEGYKGIVSFHAVVFSRWGQKIYSWDDIHGGWDGTYKGKFVKDGVYFLNVSAKGSDGVDYKIKKAITVISGYNGSENSGGSNGTNE